MARQRYFPAILFSLLIRRWGAPSGAAALITKGGLGASAPIITKNYENISELFKKENM